MQDSPLSVTASIAGILTFVAAIFAAVYVRYTTLRSGRQEMFTIFNSVNATTQQSQAALSAESEPDPWLRKIVFDLHETEKDILKTIICCISGERDGKLEMWHLGPAVPAHEAAREAGFRHEMDEVLIQRPAPRKSFFVKLRAALPFLFVLVVHLGMSGQDLRWYRARQKVLKLMGKRESARSRLLFHQASVAALYVFPSLSD
jgi:hypothetical protein